MTDKKLYTVTLSMDLIVLAKDPDEARSVAADAQYDHGRPEIEAVQDTTCYSDDWCEDAYPYVHQDDTDEPKSLGEHVRDGAAPHWKGPR